MTKVNLSGTSFGKVDDTVKHRLILSIAALEKQGKTHFSLTAPGPIAAFDFDNGMEGVVGKFTKKKEIYVSEYKMGNAQVQSTYPPIWDKFKREYGVAMRPGNGIRSVIIDTGSEMWELLRIARLGKLDGVLPRYYGPVNAEFNELVRIAYGSDKNLILLHKMKDEYINDKSTGRHKRAGFSSIGYLVQINIECYWSQEYGFWSHIVDCRQNPEVNGVDLVGEMNNFPTLAQMVFPDSSPEEWT